MHAAAGHQRTAEAFSDTEQSDCDVTASPVPSRHLWRALAGVCTRDTLSVAELGGERALLGGCCCYGNSQAGLNLISLTLCLLELWEETREEGCPETATDLRQQ